MNKRRNVTAVLLVLLGAASYGLIPSVFKLGMHDGWDAGSLTFLQVLTGSILLWIILLIKGRFRPSLRGFKGVVWAQLFMVGVCGLALSTMLYNRTLARLDASLSIVLLFQYTWITILLESIRAKRLPSRSEWLSATLIFAGTILAVGLLERNPAEMNLIGVLYGLLSAVTYSLFFFLSGYLPPSLETFAKSAVMSAASLAFIALVQGPGTFAGGGDVPIIVWGLLLGLIGTALPTICFNAGIPKTGAGLAALLGSLELPVAVLAAYLFLGEPLSWWQAAGIALILAGILAAQSRQPASAAVGPGSEE